MPSDVTGDEVGAPILCPHCHQVIRNLSDKDHVSDRDSERAAVQLARQCRTCRRGAL